MPISRTVKSNAGDNYFDKHRWAFAASFLGERVVGPLAFFAVIVSFGIEPY
jgi:hypothetical protein